MENFERRLKRFLYSDPHEIPLNVLNSIRNFPFKEIEKANDHKLDSFVFMGVHAVMQTVGEIIFGLTGLEATRFYLEHFVDGESEDLRFSKIATILHDMRNVLAHRWTSAAAYRYAIDYREKKGWWKGSDGIQVMSNLRV